MNRPRAEVRDEIQQGVGLPGHSNVTAGMERHPGMLRDTQSDGCLPCHNGTALNPQTCRRRKGRGAPPPVQLRQPTPEPRPHPPRTPPVPPGDDDAAHKSEIEGVPPRYVYIRTPLLSAEFFNPDAYGKDRKLDQDFYRDLLTDTGTCTG